MLKKLLNKLTHHRRASALVGFLAIGFSTLSIWFVLALRDFSSNVSDDFTVPPSLFLVFLFLVFFAFLVATFVFGLYLLFKSVQSRNNVS